MAFSILLEGERDGGVVRSRPGNVRLAMIDGRSGRLSNVQRIHVVHAGCLFDERVKIGFVRLTSEIRPLPSRPPVKGCKNRSSVCNTLAYLRGAIQGAQCDSDGHIDSNIVWSHDRDIGGGNGVGSQVVEDGANQFQVWASAWHRWNEVRQSRSPHRAEAWFRPGRFPDRGQEP